MDYNSRLITALHALRQLGLKMIDKLWFSQSRWAYLLLPLSVLFAGIVWLRRHAYRCGLFTVWRAKLPIVVVGNLTVGGNGKTPLVVWLVQQLQAQGLRVGVVARGYGRTIGQAVQEVDSAASADSVGDEPLLIAQRTGAPVAVAVKRARAVALLCQRYPLDLIIADDGLQHYGLHRDVEFVVIDGERRFGNGYCLPAGPLREGIGRLCGVDARIVTGGSAQPGELPLQLLLLPAVNLLSGECCSLAALPPSIAIAGIAYPERFFTLLRQQGVALQHSVAFEDHQRYQPQMLQGLTNEGQALLMTEKDAVKCRAFAQANWWFFPVAAQLPAWAKTALLQPILEKLSNGSSTA